MDGYLVVGRCAMDDIPLRMFLTKADAENYALALSQEDIIQAAPKVMRVDVSIVTGVSILPFADGKPGKAMMVVEFPDE